MEYRRLGKTDLHVSSLSLGTVELGMEYGITAADRGNRPTREDAITIIQRAVDLGVNLFDTAPNYGESEQLLGAAIGPLRDCHIATKVSIPAGNGMKSTRQYVNESLEYSLRALRRETLDIVQIHNATREAIDRGEITEELMKAKDAGKLRHIGASVYGEANALAVIHDGSFDVIQVAYSLLDQRMTKNIFPLAKESGIGIMSRSALLKGALTHRAQWLPDELSALRFASEKVVDAFEITWDDLPETALRFCLSSEYVDTVLAGVTTEEELVRAVQSASGESLGREKMKMARRLGLDEEALINPSCWPIG